MWAFTDISSTATFIMSVCMSSKNYFFLYNSMGGPGQGNHCYLNKETNSFGRTTTI